MNKENCALKLVNEVLKKSVTLYGELITSVIISRWIFSEIKMFQTELKGRYHGIFHICGALCSILKPKS